MIKMYYRRTGICKFGNNTYPRRIRRRSNLGHTFQEKKYVLWAEKYGTQVLYYKTRVLYQIPLSATNVDDYGMLTIHESNTSFPVTRKYFRMMCDKDILQLFFEGLNKLCLP